MCHILKSYYQTLSCATKSQENCFPSHQKFLNICLPQPVKPETDFCSVCSDLI